MDLAVAQTESTRKWFYSGIVNHYDDAESLQKLKNNTKKNLKFSSEIQKFSLDF